MKIFCVGLNKTATSSLEVAYKVLGYQKIYSPTLIFKKNNYNDYSKIINSGFDKNYKILFELIDYYDCFKDRPFNTNEIYKTIDRYYLNSKFILTIRNEESWWNSVEKWLSYRMKLHHSTEEKRKMKIELYKKHFETDVFSKKTFIDYYRKYNDNVQNYFHNNPNFLVMNITEGDGWNKLCPFLNLDIPNESFPRSNIFSLNNVV